MAASRETRPTVAQVVLDSTYVRQLAEFYRQLLGLEYRKGDEVPPAGERDSRGEDWLVLRNPGGVQLAFQQVAQLRESTWPQDDVPLWTSYALMLGFVAVLGGLGLWLLKRGTGLRS